jgi:rubrerythrin
MAPDPQQQPADEDRPRPAAPEPLGGEPACLLDRVCPECGRLADAAPPTTCPRCGATVGDPD